MAWTPLASVREEGFRYPGEPLPPSKEESEIGARPLDMPPRDWLILGKVFEGKKTAVIARELGVKPTTIAQRTCRAEFKKALARVEQAIVERIARGEFGVMAIFKAEAVGAARRLIGQAKLSPDEKVKFQANLSIIKHAGIQPPTPQVTESPERLIDAMTAEEAEHFAATGEFPARFADQVARLATSVLEAHERRRWRPQIEGAMPGEDATLAPEREPAIEVEEGS